MSAPNEPFLIDVISLPIEVGPIVKDCIKIVEGFKTSAAQEHDFSLPYSIVLSEIPDSATQDEGLVDYRKVYNQKYFDREGQAQLKPEYAGTSLSELVKHLPFPFSIMRLSILPPSTIIQMHTDDSCHAQLAITTNEDCFVAARSGETSHVPVDGKLYIISTTMPHTAFNASGLERIHLSISIFDEDYVKMLKKLA